MPTTRACTLLGIDDPIVLGGMSGPSSPALVAAVPATGGLGIFGATGLAAQELDRVTGAIRAH